jgi:nucleosome binding factor SPN SPT16 subunit
MKQAQNKAVHVLLNKTGLAPQKENIVAGISGGRTTSLRELSHEESIALVRYLKDQQAAKDDENKKMLGKIFYYCHQMGWTKKNIKGRTVADGQRFDEWANVYSYLKKPLNKYTHAELPKLVTQVQFVYKDFLNKL